MLFLLIVVLLVTVTSPFIVIGGSLRALASRWAVIGLLGLGTLAFVVMTAAPYPTTGRAVAIVLTVTLAAPFAAIMGIQRPLPQRLTWAFLYAVWLFLGLALALGIVVAGLEESYDD